LSSAALKWSAFLWRVYVRDLLDNVHVEIDAVPVPAVVWLFGSGLLGLIGTAARRNKKA
jgi:hypothetical protein